MKRRSGQTIGHALAALAGVCVVFAVLMFIGPKYRVWSSGMAGEAELNQAQYNRQIAVREAQAKKESAKLLAEAEVERAKGVAEANKIIGASLQNNQAYLRYLYIDKLANGENREVIYIPTEAGLPILEANRRTTPGR